MPATLRAESPLPAGTVTFLFTDSRDGDYFGRKPARLSATTTPSTARGRKAAR